MERYKIKIIIGEELYDIIPAFLMTILVIAGIIFLIIKSF
jgi:hypothetical protein